MDARAQRGLEIAANKNVRQRGNLWIVPSQSGDDPYTVDYEAGHCTCPDHTIRQKLCKHLYAVEYTIQRETTTTTETKPDGTTTTTTTVTETKRVTYKQNWTAYNAAQQEEKSRFAELLADLSDQLCRRAFLCKARTGTRSTGPSCDEVHRLGRPITVGR